MKKPLFISLFLLLSSLGSLKAQEFFVGADLVSSFMWRGMKCADVSLQPSAGVTLGGFTLMAWGSTDFNTYETHADFFLNYKYKGLKIEVANYFSQPSGEKFNYFEFGAHSTKHMFDAIVSYTFCKKFPLTLTWSTLFAGADYKSTDKDGNPKRSYSSYCEVAYPFSVKGIDLQAEIGMTPWEGMYSDKLNIVNLGFKVGKTIKVTEKFSFPISGKLIFNPYEEQTHLVFAISL